MGCGQHFGISRVVLGGLGQNQGAISPDSCDIFVAKSVPHDGGANEFFDFQSTTSHFISYWPAAAFHFAVRRSIREFSEP